MSHILEYQNLKKNPIYYNQISNTDYFSDDEKLLSRGFSIDNASTHL